MKGTLQSKLFSVVAVYTVGGIMTPDEYKSTLKSLRTEAVTCVIASRSPQQSPSHPFSSGGGGGETSPLSPSFHPLTAPFLVLLLPQQLPAQGQQSARLPLPFIQRVTTQTPPTSSPVPPIPPLVIVRGQWD